MIYYSYYKKAIYIKISAIHINYTRRGSIILIHIHINIMRGDFLFKNVKVFMSGFLTCLLLGTGVVAAAATADLTDIKAQVANTVEFKLFGKDFAPKDASGAYIKAIVYKGNQYLPVNTMANALGVPIEYVGSTKTLWIGGIVKNVAVNDKTFYEDYQNTVVTKDSALLNTSESSFKWGIINKQIMKNGSNYHFYLKPSNKFSKFKASIFLDEDVKKDLVVEFRENDKKGKVILSVTLKPGETQNIEMDIRGINKISVYSFITTAHGQLSKLTFGEPTLINEYELIEPVK